MGDNLNGIFANMIQGMGFIGCAPNRVYNMAPPDGGGVEATAEGTELTLHSAAAPLTGLTLYGKSEQRTTTGAQLLKDTYLDNVTGNKDILNSDGEIIIPQGISTNKEYDIYFSDISDILPQMQDDDAIYVCIRLIKKINQSEFGYQITFKNAENIDIINIRNDNIKQTTYSALKNSRRIQFYFYNVNQSVDISGNVFQMIISRDENCIYEPYTGGAPSPSPDYPQEIKSVGDSGEIKVDVCGGNLIDYCAAVPNATGAIRYDKERLYYSRDNHTPAIAVQGGATWVLNLKKGEIYINGSSLFPLRIYKGNVFDIGYNSANRIYSNGGNASSYKVQIPQDGTYTIGVWTDAQDIEGYLDWLNVNYIPNQTGISNYEPIQTLPVQTPNGLPGIPVSSGGNYTDADGQQWVCDEVDFKRGVYVQRIIRYTGPFYKVYWTKTDSWFVIAISLVNIPKLSYKGFCNISDYYMGSWDNLGHSHWFLQTGAQQIVIHLGDTYNTEEAVEQFIEKNGIVVYYAAETPIETPLSPSELAAYSALRTYSPTTVMSNDAGAWMNVGYKATPQPMTMLARKR